MTMTEMTMQAVAGRPCTWWMVAMLLVFAAVGVVPAARAQAQQPATAGDAASPEAKSIERGKQNFVKYTCFACHGHSGQGSDSGPRIDTNRRTLQTLMSYVRKPSGSMPPFRTQAQISDEALTDIYAYLKSIPPPPDPKTIPLLNSE